MLSSIVLRRTHHAVAVVVARAFINSQSAAAHHILFRRIFAFAEADTGCAVRFRHIHGEGFDTFMADGHKGQALGAFLNHISYSLTSDDGRAGSLLSGDLC